MWLKKKKKACCAVEAYKYDGKLYKSLADIKYSIECSCRDEMKRELADNFRRHGFSTTRFINPNDVAHFIIQHPQVVLSVFGTFDERVEKEMKNSGCF